MPIETFLEEFQMFVLPLEKDAFSHMLDSSRSSRFGEVEKESFI